MKRRRGAQMHANDNKGLGWSSGIASTLAALGLTAFALTSCASKTVALHSTPFFSPAATRQATNAVDAGDADLEIASLRRTTMSHPDDVEPRLLLAHAYEVRGFPDVALEHYRLLPSGSRLR
jgi:thioredoxin-like negative regulator of GroEL